MIDEVTERDVRVDALEATVAHLCARVEALEAAANAEPAPWVVGAGAAAVLTRAEERFDSGAVLPLLGRTSLVLGGAYLLRAFTESGNLPPALGVALGLSYGVFWLLAAWRAAGRSRAQSASFHAFAAMLIGFPLVLEVSTRLAFLGSVGGAATLGAFTGAVLLTAWRWRLQTVAAIATLASCAACVAMLIAFEDVAPFAVVAIAVGVVTLWLGYDRDWFWLRWPAALVANLAVTGLMARGLHQPPLDRPETVIGVLLLLTVTYLASVATRTLVRGRGVVAFEVVQTAAVLGLGVGGALAVARASGVGEGWFGLASVVLGLGAYAVAFAFVERRQGLGVNFYFYSTLGIALTLLGASVVLSPAALTVAVSGLAVAAAVAAARFGRFALALHAALYVVYSFIVSGIGVASVEALGGTVPALLPDAWWAVLGASLAVMVVRPPTVEGGAVGWLRATRLVIATVLVCVLGGAVIHAAVRFVPAIAGSPGHVAALRTGVLSLAAIVLALSGRVARTVELRRLVYPVLFIGFVKLILEDLPRSRPGPLFVALAVYGLALIVAPRLSRTGAVPSASGA